MLTAPIALLPIVHSCSPDAASMPRTEPSSEVTESTPLKTLIAMTVDGRTPGAGLTGGTVHQRPPPLRSQPISSPPWLPV